MMDERQEAEGIGQEGPAESADELTTARARVVELEALVAVRDGELAAAREAASVAGAEALAAYRRALIAEHAGQLVEELVQGVTREALEQSVAVAKAAWTRATEAARQALRGQQVPAGAVARAEEDLSSLNPLEKIRRGLRQ